MKYQEIREAFKKCGVLVSKDGVSIIFQQYPEPQFVVVDVDDDEMGNRGVFEELLESCDGIRIVLTPGKGNRFDFLMAMPVDHDYFFSPMRRELTFEEVMAMKSDRGPRQEFLDVFSEVDLDDEDSVLAGISEVIKRTSQGEVLQISSVRDWPAIKQAAQDFHEKLHFGAIALENPDQWDSSGGAIFDFESDKPRVYELGKDDLPLFVRLVKTANWFSLDGFSSDERANFVMSFYS